MVSVSINLFSSIET